MVSTIKRLGVAALMLTATQTWADEAALPPHVHGEASLQVVQQGSALALHLESPAINMLGFEHQPETPAQKQLAQNLDRLMRDPANAFDIPTAAGCSLNNADLGRHQETTVIPAGHDPEHDHAEKLVHSDLVYDYKLVCENPADLDAIRVKLFSDYPDLHRIKAEVISGRQGYQELTAENAVIQLRQ